MEIWLSIVIYNYFVNVYIHVYIYTLHTYIKYSTEIKHLPSGMQPLLYNIKGTTITI